MHLTYCQFADWLQTTITESLYRLRLAVFASKHMWKHTLLCIQLVAALQ